MTWNIFECAGSLAGTDNPEKVLGIRPGELAT